MMISEMRHPPDPAAAARMSTAELREAFLLEELFVPGRVRYVYSQIDRAVIGAAVPGGEPVRLETCKELAAEYFTQRRELGVINIGGAGKVRVGTLGFELSNKEALYIGKGNPEVSFYSADAGNPAQFYFISYPAHAGHPCVKAGKAQAQSLAMGSAAEANRRAIHRLIQPGIIQTCQLTMGFTELAEGSVWNTMPAHTHGRRSEIYLYFDLPQNGIVVHCMGQPQETRHIVVRDRQAIISPNWSVHFGAGTSNYSFVWAMGGENQEFADMDMVPMKGLM